MRVVKTVTVMLTGEEGIVDRCLAVLLRAQHLGSWGCSRHIVFSVDGDGSDRLKTDIPKSYAREVRQSNLYMPGDDRELFDYDCQIVTDTPQPNPQPEEARLGATGRHDNRGDKTRFKACDEAPSPACETSSEEE